MATGRRSGGPGGRKSRIIVFAGTSAASVGCGDLNPRPVISRRKQIDDLPVADVLQKFHDITDGLRDRMNTAQTHPSYWRLCVTDGVLHWTVHKYYNVDNIDYRLTGRRR